MSSYNNILDTNYLNLVNDRFTSKLPYMKQSTQSNNANLSYMSDKYSTLEGEKDSIPEGEKKCNFNCDYNEDCIKKCANTTETCNSCEDCEKEFFIYLGIAILLLLLSFYYGERTFKFLYNSTIRPIYLLFLYYIKPSRIHISNSGPSNSDF